MIFRQEAFQKVARAKITRYKTYSYQKLADWLICSKSQAWNLCNLPSIEICIDDFLLICRYLEINPLDYIVKDEVQLQLL